MTVPLPNYIRMLRRRAHLSQEDLARLLGGMTGSSVLRHEDYQRTPILRTALRYAAIFRLDPRDVFAGMYAAERKLVQEQARQLLEELNATNDDRDTARKLAFLQQLAEVDDFVYEPCEE